MTETGLAGAAATVLWAQDGAVATITLNRPQARNALTTGMKESLLAAVRRAAADPAVRAVIITGAGGAATDGGDHRLGHGRDGGHDRVVVAPHRAERWLAGRQQFAVLPQVLAGAEGAAGTGDDHRPHRRIGCSPADGEPALGTVRRHYNPIVTAIATMPKPVVAAIGGSAAGAGAALALACDLRIAGRGASLLMAFARVGLGPDSGSSWMLQRLAGPGRAAQMLILAEPMTADQALAAGLVTSVVDDGEVTSAAQDLAARLAAGPTLAYAAIKAALAYSASHDLTESLENEARLQEELGRTADHQAATAAFLRKERPVFEGR